MLPFLMCERLNLCSAFAVKFFKNISSDSVGILYIKVK